MTLVHSLVPNYDADITAFEPRAPVLVTGTGLPGMREANIDRASLPLQFQLSVSRAPQSPLCLSNVPDCQTHPGTRSWPHFTPLELWEQ